MHTNKSSYMLSDIQSMFNRLEYNLGNVLFFERTIPLNLTATMTSTDISGTVDEESGARAKILVDVNTKLGANYYTTAKSMVGFSVPNATIKIEVED